MINTLSRTNRYVGGKFTKLRFLLPFLSIKSEIYVEPFAGSLAVLLNRPMSKVEIANDLNGALIRYWKIVKKDPSGVVKECADILHHEAELARSYKILTGEEEASDDRFAAYFLVSIYMSFCATQKHNFALSYRGTMHTGALQRFAERDLPRLHERVRRVQYTQKDIIHFLKNYEERLKKTDDAFLYLDPPYLLDTTTNDTAYSVGGMTDGKHENMLTIIKRMSRNFPSLKIALSGYPNDMYDDALLGKRSKFKRVHQNFQCLVGNIKDKQKTRTRTECLWYNYRITNASLFGEPV